MRVEFLGSGGSITTPRPGCHCRVCDQARQRGVPYSRTGPAIFIHGPQILIDTPEEIKEQLNRAAIDRINACFYSHWHPDHTMGRRVWETRNADLRHWPPQHQTTDIYLPQQVALDFQQRLGLAEHFSFMERQGYLRVIELADSDSPEINGVRVQPFRVAEDYVYAFLIDDGSHRILIAPDELNGWEPPDWLGTLDLAVLPMGLAEFDPATGERRIPAEHPVLRTEATFDETLAIIDRLDTPRTILTHIEEMDGLSHDDLQELARQSQANGKAIEFAWDTLVIEVG